jgi:hypothetical protein
MHQGFFAVIDFPTDLDTRRSFPEVVPAIQCRNTFSEERDPLGKDRNYVGLAIGVRVFSTEARNAVSAGDWSSVRQARASS